MKLISKREIRIMKDFPGEVFFTLKLVAVLENVRRKNKSGIKKL